MQWYYVTDEKQRMGPVSDDEFQDLVNRQQIKTGTLVWCSGMADWQPYGELKAKEPRTTPNMTADPYQSPQSDVQTDLSFSGEQYSSVEAALAGNYELVLGDVISEAWERTKGLKGSIWAGSIIIWLITFFISGLSGFFQEMMPDFFVLPILFQIIATFITMPMQVGLLMIGVRRAIDRPFSFSLIFEYFSYFIPLLFTTLLLYICVGIGFILLIIPGIYLAVGYAFATMLVIEKGMGPWEALETSRKAVTKKWFTFFLIGIVFSLIIIVSIVPLGIGLIWTLPMSSSLYGVVYRNVFGVGKLGTPEPRRNTL